MVRSGILFSLLLLISTGLTAQHISDEKGKKYYDEEKTKLKEVYSYEKIHKYDPRNPDEERKTELRKHGPYFYYYRNGQLKISGNYKEGSKHGDWKHYDQKGNLTKLEKFKKGKLRETIEEPEPEEESGN